MPGRLNNAISDLSDTLDKLASENNRIIRNQGQFQIPRRSRNHSVMQFGNIRYFKCGFDYIHRKLFFDVIHRTIQNHFNISQRTRNSAFLIQISDFKQNYGRNNDDVSPFSAFSKMESIISLITFSPLRNLIIA
jgi:hypothetical protein